MVQDSRLLFEDMTFTVRDHGATGVEVAFAGLHDGEEASGSKWFLEAAGQQVREICDVAHRLDNHRVPKLLTRLTGVERQWQTLDRAGTRWIREGDGCMVRVERAEGGDGEAEYWLQTVDDEGVPIAPRETAEVFDASGAREEAAVLAAYSATAPRS